MIGSTGGPSNLPQHAQALPAEAQATLPDDPLAASLRGFGALGLSAILVIVFADALFKPLGAILALVWAQRSHTPWREIGYVRPRSWIGGLALGMVLGIAFKLLMKSIVMPLIGADAINQPYHYLAGNTAALPGMLFMLIIGAGFGEETVFRGFLFERLGKLFGSGPGAKVSIVLITSVLFGLGHYLNLGITGVIHATMTGLVFGTIFAVTGRIWMLMCMHAAFDVASLAIIYWDIEADVAHLLFK